MKLFKITTILFLFFSILNAKDTKFNYSYGFHDFIIKNEHAFGINGGIQYQSTIFSNTLQKFSFYALYDYDPHEHDPDHIPIWFKGEYHLSNNIYAISPHLDVTLNGDILWKMNTVSGIEQNFKANFGVGVEYLLKDLVLDLKIAPAAYYHEFDDDKPRELGYSRGEFTLYWNYATMYALGVQYRYNNIDASITYYQWRKKDFKLEDNILLEIKLHNTNQTNILLDLEYTRINLSPYHKHSSNILPWNSDLLVKLSLQHSFL